jgi:diacylglycerol kinase (ATP)
MEFQKIIRLSRKIEKRCFALKGAFDHDGAQCNGSVLSWCNSVSLAGYFKITASEWLFQTLAIGLVMSVEGINTAVEKIADFIHPNYNEKIGFIKDIAAGAVFFAAITAIVIGLIIYVPYIRHIVYPKVA